MKYLKIFEEFHKDELNEEISLKPIVPLISSLFISLNSLAGVFIAPTTAVVSTKPLFPKGYVINELDNVFNDLNTLKEEVKDPELSDLIKSVDHLKQDKFTRFSPDEILDVCSKIEKFAKDNDMYDQDISDSLNHIKSKDIEKLKIDYKILFKKSKDAIDENSKIILIILLVLMLLIPISGYVTRKFIA